MANLEWREEAPRDQRGSNQGKSRVPPRLVDFFADGGCCRRIRFGLEEWTATFSDLLRRGSGGVIAKHSIPGFTCWCSPSRICGFLQVGPPQMLAEVSAALSVPTTVGRPEGDEAAVVRRQNKYLAVTWYTNLGFNNMRFILETALYLARLLDRQLILPPRLRMRTCLDEAVCLQSKCIKQDGHFWCPTTSFLSWSELNRAGAVNPKVTAEFLKGKTRRAVDGAFSEMFSKSTLFLDSLASLPPTVRTGLNSTGHYSPPSTSKAVEFDFYKFHLGCELTYSKVDTATWSSTRDRDTAMGIRGLVDEYGDMSEEVLHLKGTPHNIGLTPTYVSFLFTDCMRAAVVDFAEIHTSVWNDPLESCSATLWTPTSVPGGKRVALRNECVSSVFLT